MRAKWISAETAAKEQDFRGLLGGIHIPICKAIRERKGRPTDPPYLFVDLNGGPGWLEYGAAERFPGSPIIALEELDRAGLPHQTLHYECDAPSAALLTAAVGGRPTTAVLHQPFEAGLPRWLDHIGQQPYRHGLVYSDPINDPIPVGTFNRVAERLDRVDLLAYVAANSHYKRANANGHGHGRRLADDIEAVHKKTVLLRAPRTAHQWTFILWTNWTDFPAWTKRGFYRADSPQGRTIIDRLNLTEAELLAERNTPLPFEPIEQGPYSSYAEYLRHPRFLAVRAKVFSRAGDTCERCKERPPSEPHHLKYPPWGTFDVPENMIAICHQCHCEIHGKAS